MMLSEQLSGVQNTLSEFIKSQQASGSGSRPRPSLRRRQHHRSTYAAAAPPPPPQPQCQNDDDEDDDDGDGDGDEGGDGDGDGDDHGYDLYSTYNYCNFRTSNIRQISCYVRYIGYNGLWLHVLRSSGFLNSL